MTDLTLVNSPYQYPFPSDMSPELAVAFHLRNLGQGYYDEPPFIEGAQNTVAITTVVAGERNLHPQYELVITEAHSKSMVEGIARSMSRHDRRVVMMMALPIVNPMMIEDRARTLFEAHWEEFVFSRGGSIRPPLSVVPKA